MMIQKQLYPIRTATSADRMAIAHLTHFSPYVHLHSDWRAPLDWLGRSPFLMLMHDEHPAAVLACPPDPPHTAWLRLFACQNISPQEAWDALWPAALEILPSQTTVAVVGMHPWLRRLLTQSGFQTGARVVVLRWSAPVSDLPERLPPGVHLRPMAPDDIPAAFAIDRQAFRPLWHYSEAVLREALAQAALATVAEGAEGILGFQISTASPLGAHLARLAVHPRHQQRGIGTALVAHVLRHFQEQGAIQVTVNTQHDNEASLRLYQRLGFQQTGNTYPIFLYPIERTDLHR